MPEKPSPDRPVLYLHCGGYKTGTTSIQGFFSVHRQELLEKFKILYPVAGRRVNSGVILPGHPPDACYAHHLLAHYGRKALRQKKGERIEFRTLIQSLKQEFSRSGAGSLFLSTELLTSCGPKLRHLLLSQFTSFDIRILYSVRNPADYVESMNNQILGARGKLSCEHRRLPFLSNLDEWAAAVGPSNVHVFAFSPRRFSQYTTEFFDACGIPGLSDFAVPRLPRLNGSLSLEGIMVRDFLDGHLPDRALLNHSQRHDIDLLINEIDQSLSFRTPLVSLTLEERRRIGEVNRPDMDEIIRKHLKPDSAEFLLSGQSPKAGIERNFGREGIFTVGDLLMIHRKLTEKEIVEPVAAERLFDGPPLKPETRLDHAGLRHMLGKLSRRVRRKPRLQQSGRFLIRKVTKLLRNGAADLLAESLFGMLSEPARAEGFASLPAFLRKPAAEYLSRHGGHAQALALDPDPIGRPALRAGILTPFGRQNPDFSASFDFWQGLAWLECHGGSPLPSEILAEWMGGLPGRHQERALALLCQTRLGDFRSFQRMLPEGFPEFRWFAEMVSRSTNPAPGVYKDINQNLLTLNRLKRVGNHADAAALLGSGFNQLGLQAPPAGLFAGYSPSPAPVQNRQDPAFPKISIILCAWNAAEFLPVALSSIIGQSYPNLEIIAIDDCSTDGTPAVMEQWLGGRSDSTIVRNGENQGAYACRNRGLELATGEFVTFHDADDWSSPEKIELQWKAICRSRGALASSSDWFRIDAETGLCFARRVYPLCRWNCSSFLFHRSTALRVLGFYDSVRTGADSEYVARFEAAFGPHRHVRVRLPLSIGLEHRASLTGNSQSGFDVNGLSEPRRIYQEIWRAWHARGCRRQGGLYLAAGRHIGPSPADSPGDP